MQDGLVEQRPQRRCLAACLVVFCAATGLRLGFLCLHGPTVASDSRHYLLLAENLRNHGVFSVSTSSPYIPTIRRAPLYPLALAAAASLGISTPASISVVQALIDALTAVGVLLLAGRASSLRLATASGLAYAAYPGAIWASTYVLTETLFSALCVAGVLGLVVAVERRSWRLAIGSGLLLGAAALCRPIALPLPAVLGLALLAALGWRSAAPYTACLVGGAMIVVVPWSVRCTYSSQGLVLVQGASAVQLYVPTRVDLDQGAESILWPTLAKDPYGSRLNQARKPNETLLADKLGFRLAWQNVRARPAAYLASRLRAFPHLCITSFDAVTGINKSFGEAIRQRDVASLAIKLGLLATFAVAPLALAILSLRRRQVRTSVVLTASASIWIFTLLVHAPLWIEPRFWTPAVPFLMVSAFSALNGPGPFRPEPERRACDVIDRSRQPRSEK